MQRFQSQLTQQLEILHKTVAVSVTQQEQQLKDMEEDMKSFVSTKAEVRSQQRVECISKVNYLSNNAIFLVWLKATDELRERLGKFKAMYGSGIKALDDISGELEGNSRSTFVDLNAEVSKHASALEDVSSL